MSKKSGIVTPQLLEIALQNRPLEGGGYFKPALTVSIRRSPKKKCPEKSGLEVTALAIRPYPIKIT